MKVAIYGDSFAAEYLDVPHNYLGWPEIMANQSDLDVTNFAVSGSSIYFNYKEFLENHKFYDVNIFLITSYDRLYVKSIPNYNGRKSVKHIPSPINLILRKKEIPPTLDLETKNQLLKIFDAVDKYYEYLQDDEYNNLVNNALLYHARSISNNTIFIHCFDGNSDFSLIDIYNMETNSMKIHDKYFSKNIHLNVEINGKILVDKRVCHLTKRNNEILAEKLIAAVRNNKMIFDCSIEDFAVPEEDEIDQHLIFREVK